MVVGSSAGRKKNTSKKPRKNKNPEEGTRSGSLCLRTPEKKKNRRKQRAAREEERKEKLRVRVDGGQLTIHRIKMFQNKKGGGGWL